MTRNGKIARLPREIRDALNRRLERNIPGISLVDWLNSLPEVQEITEALFEGKPINPQNLSEWRHGGFAEWQAENDFLERLRDLAISSETIEATCGHMADHAARLLSARMALIIANPSSSDDALANLKHLTPLVRNLTLLRRADHSAARLKLAQQIFDQTRKGHDHRPPAAAPFPEATRTQSNQIKPLNSTPPKPESKPRQQPQPERSPTVEQGTNGPSGARTQSNQIKPENTPAKPDLKRGPQTQPDGTKAPETSPTPRPAPFPTGIVTQTNATIPSAPTAAPVPVTAADPWQWRNRAPSDPTPAWRIQLPIKTIPPWLSSIPYDAPPTPNRALMGF